MLLCKIKVLKYMHKITQKDHTHILVGYFFFTYQAAWWFKN